MTVAIKIGQTSELPAPGEVREFNCGDRAFCITNVNGEYTALDNVCPHRGGPLGQGVIEGGRLVCPWHGWQFDPKSGAVDHAPDQKIPTYPIKIEGEDVIVECE
jgi:nitrite reductase (NADH) small subunit